MHLLASKFRKYDMHRKTKDHIQTQEVSGAIITLLSIFVVLFLVRNEWATYRKVEMVSSMIPDKSVGIEAIEIQLSVAFKSIPCNEIEFQQSVTRGTLHTHEPSQISKTKTGRGCLMSGTVVVDKQDGNFRFSIKPTFGKVESNTNFPGLEPLRPILPRDLTHQVNYLRFIPREHVSDKGVLELYPKDSSFKTMESKWDDSEGMQHYGVRVVSTHEKFMNKTVIHKTQLSVVDKPIPLEVLAQGVNIASQSLKNELGVLVTYEFYPIMLESNEKRMQTLFEFLTGLCAIIGGAITVLGLLDRVVYEGTKSLIGKQD